MIIFGGIGYVMRKYNYEGAPLLLALILGPIMETSFRQSLIIGDPTIFFKKPISALLLGATFFLLVFKHLMKIIISSTQYFKKI